MPAAEIDHTAAPEASPDTSCDFPRFEQFLSRQAARSTDGSGDPVQERGVREALEIVVGEPRLRRGRKDVVDQIGSPLMIRRNCRHGPTSLEY